MALLALWYFIFSTGLDLVKLFKFLKMIFADKQNSNVNFFAVPIISFNHISFRKLIARRRNDESLCTKRLGNLCLFGLGAAIVIT
jgi:hypothetical protein